MMENKRVTNNKCKCMEYDLRFCEHDINKAYSDGAKKVEDRVLREKTNWKNGKKSRLRINGTLRACDRCGDMYKVKSVNHKYCEPACQLLDTKKYEIRRKIYRQSTKGKATEKRYNEKLKKRRKELRLIEKLKGTKK